MTNQQVDDVLNDYFADLLGDFSSDVKSDKTSAKNEQSSDISVPELAPEVTLESADKEKSEVSSEVIQDVTSKLKSIKDSLNSKSLNKSESTENSATRIEKQKSEKSSVSRTDVLEESYDSLDVTNEDQAQVLAENNSDIEDYQANHPKNFSSNIDQLTSADKATSRCAEQISNLSDDEELSKELSPAEDSIRSHPGNDTETDIYDEHKSRLERMLRQVTALTSAQENSVESKIETQAKTSVQTDLNLSEPILTTPETTLQKLKQVIETSQSEVSPTSELKVDSSSKLTPIIRSQWNQNGRPEWAQERFDILLLEVDGLQLAVPLITLGQIHEIDDEITPLFGQSSWFMGLQQSTDGNIKVVNTAKLIMPERYKGENNYKYVISINELDWGLAVDNIKQPISIDPDSIRWRAKRDSRPWMAGMVKDHMCVLLDIPKVGEILQAHDKNRAD
jgi:purine-binding chemotaxis protein CheW